MTTDTTRRPDPVAGTESTARTGVRWSAWTIVTGGSVAAIVGLSAYGGGDPDLFWHRILGGVWWRQHSVHLPSHDPIAYSRGEGTWRPTAWAVELLYDRIVAGFGYDGIAALRLVVSIAIAVTLATYLSGRLPAMRAGLLLLLVGVPLALDIQDRPQTISFLLAACMLPSIHRWYVDRSLPGAVPVAIFSWVWANMHGLWVLVPTLLGLAVVCELRTDRARSGRALLLLAVALAAGSLTPVGPALLLLPFKVRGAAAQISEWEPTSLELPFTWGLAAIMILVVVGYARRRTPVPFHQIAYALMVSTFGMTAFRNVIVASVLLLPPAVDVIQSALPRWRSTLQLPRYLVIAVCTLLLVAGAATYLRQPVLAASNPTKIAAELAASDRPVRVMNDYNISGFLREFGGPQVRLAIDGRADRYGATTIREYGNMTEGIRGWRKQFESYDPDLVVIDRRSPLREHLTGDGWTVRRVDEGFVLLQRPS
jgi:hypothetical protein